MKTAREPEIGYVQPLGLAEKAALLPSVSVKIALGAAFGRKDDQASVTFENETTILNFEDFDLAARAARRLTGLMRKKVTPGSLIDAVSTARGLVLDELFAPGIARILFFPSASAGSAFYRCGVPALSMNMGTRCRAHVSTGRSVAEAADFDAVVFQLDHTESTISFARTLKDLGKKIVFELDDAFDALEPWHPQYDVYQRPEERDRVFRMMELADAVTVTTHALADRYGAHADLLVLPNFIPLREWMRALPHGTGEFRIVWAGSESHRGDLELVAPALAEFSRLHENVRIFLFGMDGGGLGLPKEKVSVLPNVPYGDYPAVLSGLSADVAIAPLVDGEFNRCKSNVKLLEYGACGYPVIASPVGPYQDEAVFQAGPGAWTEALAYLYEHKGKREELGRASFELASEYDMERNVRRIEDLYLGILGRS